MKPSGRKTLLATALTTMIVALAFSETMPVASAQPPSKERKPTRTPQPTVAPAPRTAAAATARPTPPPSPGLSPAPWPSLGTYEFVTVRVDQGGNVTETRKGQAQYFTEELGEGMRLEIVAIPGGVFNMGSPESEKNRYLSEGPQLFKVTVPPFYMGRFEVTQAQWRAVARWPKVSQDLSLNPSVFKASNRPVESVSWAEALEFCARLSRRTGRTYRLPSEAEWEYACRAGTTTPFTFGEALTIKLANFGNYRGGSGLIAEYPNGTTPVGHFGAANAFGLFDMHGNVWEWCLGVYHASYRGAPRDGSAWESEINGYRIMRGGSWGNLEPDCRSARRGWRDIPDIKIGNQGFRVAMPVSLFPHGRSRRVG